MNDAPVEKSWLQRAETFGKAWAAVIGAITVTWSAVPLLKQIWATIPLWVPGAAGVVVLSIVLIYTHHRRLKAERALVAANDRALANATEPKSDVRQLGAPWPIEQALQVELRPSDRQHPSVILQNHQTDLKLYVRMVNIAPFVVTPLALKLSWEVADEAGGIFMRGTKDVVDAFRELAHGNFETVQVDIQAEAIARETPCHLRIATVGHIVASAEGWGGTKKASIGSFGWGVVADQRSLSAAEASNGKRSGAAEKYASLYSTIYVYQAESEDRIYQATTDARAGCDGEKAKQLSGPKLDIFVRETRHKVWGGGGSTREGRSHAVFYQPPGMTCTEPMNQIRTGAEIDLFKKHADPRELGYFIEQIGIVP